MCCRALIHSISNLLFQFEKFSIWLAVTAITCCIVATIIVTLVLGIGLGFNYCFVDYKTSGKYAFFTSEPPPPPPEDVTETVTQSGDGKYLRNMLTEPRRNNTGITELIKSYGSRKPEFYELADLNSKLRNRHNASNDIKTAVKIVNVNNDFKFTTDPLEKYTNNPTETTPRKANASSTEAPPQKNDLVSISGLDLIALLSQLRSENRNFSLQITTN